MIKEMIENQVVFAAKAGDGNIIEAPFRKFTPHKDILKHYLKNLIGSAVGKPEVINGQVVTGADTSLQFSLGSQPGIGMRIQFSIPRDKPLGVISAIMEFAIPDSAGIGMINYQMPFKIQPSKNGEVCTFMVLAAYNIDTEIYPLLSKGFFDAIAVPPVDIRQAITILDGDAPEGTSVTVWKLNLSDTKLRNYVNSLKKNS